MRRIFILGASGSIGKKALHCIEHLNALYKKQGCENKCFSIVGLSVKKNHQAILKAADRFSPASLVVLDDDANKIVKDQLKKEKSDRSVKIFSDLASALEQTPYDILLNAVSGGSGLLSTAMAARDGKKILLANKESLVMGGELLCKMMKKSGATIIPIDSEHSALLHLMKGRKKEEVKKLILTASGGPFWENSIKNPTIKEVLSHPNWSMGKKITVDSATMINKGLEVIEAHHLFDFDYDDIEIIVHPQSILHSLIETIDGERYAQLGAPEMGYAIQNALTHPEIFQTPYPKLGLEKFSGLTFFPMDFKRFPLAKMAYWCGKKGSTWPTVLNAANEQAVYLFLDGAIDFEKIPHVVEQTLEKHSDFPAEHIDQLIELDKNISNQIRLKYGAKN